MKRLMISLLGALAFTAAAQGAPQNAPATDASTVARNEAQTDAKKPDINDAYCLRQTGTHITHRATTRKTQACNMGRSYTREDLQHTGQTNVADALRMLDPSIH